MATSLAISALQRFIQKPTPDNIAPPKPGDEKMGDGLFKPGVLDNQSAIDTTLAVVDPPRTSSDLFVL